LPPWPLSMPVGPMSATKRKLWSSSGPMTPGGTSKTVGPSFFRSNTTKAYRLSVFPVRTRALESRRSAVTLMCELSFMSRSRTHPFIRPCADSAGYMSR
jgi:hypothetical protein